MTKLFLQITGKSWQLTPVEDLTQSDLLKRRNIQIAPGCTIEDGAAIGNGITLAPGSVVAYNYALLPYDWQREAVLVNIGQPAGPPFSTVGGKVVSIGMESQTATEWIADDPDVVADIAAVQALYGLNPHWQAPNANTLDLIGSVHLFDYHELNNLYRLKGYSTFHTFWR
jgi:hypothetical protein